VGCSAAEQPDDGYPRAVHRDDHQQVDAGL
jgi:hypothetical protein